MDKIITDLPLEDDPLRIVTRSGISGICDVKPYLQGSAFKGLHDPSYFRLVRLAHHGIAWPHEQDISSDTILHEFQQITK